MTFHKLESRTSPMGKPRESCRVNAVLWWGAGSGANDAFVHFQQQFKGTGYQGRSFKERGRNNHKSTR
jgi:hypothetical protein